MEPNDFHGESSSSSVSAKKKLRKTKCHRGPKPFAKRYKYAKICTERCERILRFFKHQSRLTGIPVTYLVSQSLSRRQVRIESLHEKWPENWGYFGRCGVWFQWIISLQVGEVVQLQLEGAAYNPNPDEPFGLLPDVKEELKEEPKGEDVNEVEV